MNFQVKFSHTNNSRVYKNTISVREGREVYIHPQNRFVVLEFQGKSGKFREAFRPEEIMQSGIMKVG